MWATEGAGVGFLGCFTRGEAGLGWLLCVEGDVRGDALGEALGDALGVVLAWLGTGEKDL